ncbi:MAG: DUF4440 domain-containing protein [Acidobacteriota bacterium]|nr:DUF4440 domain-containing protein [Acidobacteriota bacterium]
MNEIIDGKIENEKFIVASPGEINETFAKAFNSGSVENLLALYEPEAVLVNRKGESLVGLNAIRQELTNLLALGGTMISENQYAFQMEDIALLRARFVLKTVSAQGEPLEIIGNTSEVVRRQADGNWLYIIDHPFGANA